jgi:hypothetical protein
MQRLPFRHTVESFGQAESGHREDGARNEKYYENVAGSQENMN